MIIACLAINAFSFTGFCSNLMVKRRAFSIAQVRPLRSKLSYGINTLNGTKGTNQISTILPTTDILR